MVIDCLEVLHAHICCSRTGCETYMQPPLVLSPTPQVQSVMHQPPYDGPYRVVDRAEKYFTVDVKGRQDTVSVDRLKPAHLDTPPHSPSTNPVHPPMAADTLTSADQPTRATRSGRHVHWPSYLWRYRIRAIFGGSLVWRLLSYIQLEDIIIGGPYIGTEFLSLHLLFLPLEVLSRGCHHR